MDRPRDPWAVTVGCAILPLGFDLPVALWMYLALIPQTNKTPRQNANFKRAADRDAHGDAPFQPRTGPVKSAGLLCMPSYALHQLLHILWMLIPSYASWHCMAPDAAPVTRAGGRYSVQESK